MKLECCNNKPVVSCKELGTPENPAVLEDPPTSTNEDVIDLSYPFGIAITSPAVQLWSLIPRTCESQPSGFLDFAKFRRRLLLVFLVPEPWRPTHN